MTGDLAIAPDDATTSKHEATAAIRLSPVGTDNDTSNGKRFAIENCGHARYEPLSKNWLVWNGKCWAPDARLAVVELAKQTARRIYLEGDKVQDSAERVKLAKWSKASQSAQRIDAMLKMARSERKLYVDVAKLDAARHLLNVENGTVDLRTGKLRPHAREDWVTKVAPAACEFDAECPRWTQFLAEIFEDDAELIIFMRRAVGYSLTGEVNERAMFVLHGAGRNGKSTFVNVLRKILGAYAWKTHADALMLGRAESASSANHHVADLRGRRFVVASEISEGARLNTALVKDLTGNETINARKLYGPAANFEPTFKIWLTTNHKPSADATDAAIWDRLLLVPFERRFEKNEEDRDLERKLLDEAPGILNWAIVGAGEWYASGLNAPGWFVSPSSGTARIRMISPTSSPSGATSPTVCA